MIPPSFYICAAWEASFLPLVSNELELACEIYRPLTQVQPEHKVLEVTRLKYRLIAKLKQLLEKRQKG